MGRKLELGNSAPDFSLPTFDGSSVSLTDFTGKPLIVILLRSLT